MPDCEFNVGDIVRVVEEPVDCAFSWVGGMNRFCGKEYKILKVEWSSYKEAWRYNLCEIDGGLPVQWNWCARCFESPCGDFETSDEFDTKDLFGLL